MKDKNIRSMLFVAIWCVSLSYTGFCSDLGESMICDDGNVRKYSKKMENPEVEEVRYKNIGSFRIMDEVENYGEITGFGEIKELRIWDIDWLITKDDEMPHEFNTLLFYNVKNIAEHIENIGHILQNAKIRNLEFNDCSDLPKEVYNAKHVKTFRVDDSGYKLPDGIENLGSELKCLNLKGILELPRDVGELQNLRKLYVGFIGEEAELSDEIATLKNLKCLSITGKLKKLRLPENITEMERLEWLNLPEKAIANSNWEEMKQRLIEKGVRLSLGD